MDLETAVEAVLVLAALAAGLGILCRLDPAWAATGGIVTSVFNNNWGNVVLPVPIDRVFLLIAIVLVVLRLGAARDRPDIRIASVHWVLAAVAAVGILSALWAGTLAEPSALFSLIDSYGLSLFVMFALAPALFHTARQRTILLGGLVALGGYLSLTAVAETLNLNGLIFPRYIANPALGIHAERARGPFLEAAANGMALFICAVAAAIAASVWREHRRARWIASAVAVACVFASFLTLTRAIWLSVVVASLVVMLGARELRRFVLPALAVGGVAVIAALAFIPALSQSTQQRAADQRPVWDRLNLLTAGERMIAERPLTGVGWGRSAELTSDYQRQSDDFPLTVAQLAIHNVFVAHAAELGLPGAALWVLGLVAAIGTAIGARGPPELRPWRLGLAAIAIQWVIMANFVPLSYAFANLTLWAWAGVVCAWLVRDRGPRMPIG